MTSLTQYNLYNPGPVQTSPAVKAASISADVCHRSPQFSELLHKVRSALATLVDVPCEAVLLPGSATFALEAAVLSFTRPGDRCLVASTGTYGQRLIDVCRTHQRPTTSLEWPMGEPIDAARVRAALDAGDVDCLLLVHHETSSGYLNDLAELSTLAGRAGVKLIVDAVSSLGAEPVDLYCENWCLVTSGNKCMESLPGLGIVLASPSMWASVSPAGVYSLDLTKHLVTQRISEVVFTPPVNAILALEAALEELFAEGVAQRRHRYTTALDFISDEFTRLGLSRLVPAEHSASSLAVFSLPDGVSYDNLFDRFYAAGAVIYGAHGPLSETHFRISVMGRKSLDDLHHLVSVMTEATSHVPH